MLLEDALSAAMTAAQAGDAAAYRTLLRDCMPVIASAARGKGVRGEAVDDVVQETLITLHRARASYDPARPFLPWLRAIAQRRAIDALRRDNRRPKEVDDAVAYEAHADDSIREATHGLEARESETRLAQAVAALPAGQRQAVEELGYRERSLAETAALTGRSAGALKVNLHRALKALRGSLTDARRDGDV
ncbi:sigma-70 family RNA polymerase sigma factor [Methylobacterium brachythecii]|uniref:RNA polymerase sigma factor n=1 Tax=Methylobacterium brachythecii TaxID=1176177 RepID=UPI0024E0B6DB